MLVTGALPWWNEQPSDLAACIRGLGNIVDRVVALDGSYVRYPEATARSPRNQANAIERAARQVGIGCLILQPNKLWAGQVEKRSYLLSAAAVNSDWIVTVDADQIIHTDRESARNALAGTNDSVDVIEVTYYTPTNQTRPMKESAVGVWHEAQAGTRVSIPHIWRALPGMRVEKFHWWISAIKDGRRVWLWSNGGDYPVLAHHPMSVPYEVEHRALMRTPEQIRLSRGFLNDREQVVKPLTGQEDDVPGLPPPKFDYKQNQTW